ncbi:hypothetical protein B296_00008948 [Ensete ventricosum]|uniref:Transmembrane protein n=1 Tax=Ensete ventricosum TaxID=4639 RepID=A0A427B0L1_ENSVE|nr:hypothetical protein B296_00008948 [Ensete ventricosum]
MQAVYKASSRGCWSQVTISSEISNPPQQHPSVATAVAFPPPSPSSLRPFISPFRRLIDLGVYRRRRQSRRVLRQRWGFMRVGIGMKLIFLRVNVCFWFFTVLSGFVAGFWPFLVFADHGFTVGSCPREEGGFLTIYESNFSPVNK